MPNFNIKLNNESISSTTTIKDIQDDVYTNSININKIITEIDDIKNNELTLIRIEAKAENAANNKIINDKISILEKSIEYFMHRLELILWLIVFLLAATIPIALYVLIYVTNFDIV